MQIDVKTNSKADERGIATNYTFVVTNHQDESINDFHLFCISVIRDLINNDHKLDSRAFKYDFNLEPDDAEYMNEDLDYLWQVISAEKYGFEKELKKITE